MMVSEETIKVSWYLPQELVYKIKYSALDQRMTFSDLVTNELKKYVDNPRDLKKREWTWRNKRQATVYLPPDLHYQIKKMALERSIPLNSLVYSILSEVIE